MNTPQPSPNPSSDDSLWRIRSESCARRRRHATAIKADPELQKRDREVCEKSVVYWLEQWGWTYDPREKTPVLPFDPFLRQVQFFEWLDGIEDAQKDGLVEKSRDMGITWCAAAFAVHRWLFREGYAVGFGSLKREEVDELGNLDTILEKCRFLIREQPEHLLPVGWSEHYASFCRIINPANGASITGEGGDEIGRGGRKTAFFLDEAARVARAQLVDAALSQTTRTRVDLSTPKGMGGSFFRRRNNLPSAQVFTFHWKDDPRKGQAWYDAECKRIGDPVIIAQELDIDYSASMEGMFIPAAWVRAAIDLKLPESGPVTAGEDIGEEGPDETVIMFRRGPVVREFVAWNKTNTTQTAYKTIEECQARSVKVLHYDADGPGMGVKGTWASMSPPPPFVINPIHNGSTPSADVYWPDGRNSAEKFGNRKAELWWIARRRFERTYEYVTQGIQHPVDELISIPNDPLLVSQLSMPKVRYNDTGKIVVEPKKSLRARGVKSPDRAEALVYSFAPEPPTSWSGSDPGQDPFSKPPRGTFLDDREAVDMTEMKF